MHDELLAALETAVGAVHTGGPDDDSALYGPVITVQPSVYGLEEYTRVKHVMHKLT